MSNERPDLVLQGICLALMLCVGTHLLTAQTYRVLHNFRGYDGSYPQAGLTIDSAGNLYGTTSAGGVGNCNGIGVCGTVFKLTRVGSTWFFQRIHTFAGPPGDGAEPAAKLSIGPDGSLYGTTSLGGARGCLGYGCGTVFKFTPPAPPSGNWAEQILHSFQGPPQDGELPWGDLTLKQDGSIYGTTQLGGRNGGSCTGSSCGTVYKLAVADDRWVESVLYQFGLPEAGPYESGVIFDQNGKLYGTSGLGAFSNGTVYELESTGITWCQVVLHTFTGGSDGAFPAGTLLRDGSGNLYGGAVQAGPDGHGVVYELTPSLGGFSFSVIYAFTECCGPGDTLSMDSAGSLYGTNEGGAYRRGQVFKLILSNGNWTFTDLYDFTGGSDGGYPEGNVTID